jgi:MurNAc alpha-1-phosphate uridylyltransferase
MLGDGRRYGVSITYSEEGEPPLETAGGIVRALPLLGSEPFIVANCDIVTDFDYAQLSRVALGNAGGLLGTLVLVPNPDHHPAGDFGIDAGGYACTAGERLTFAGISLLHPALFAGHAAVRAPLRPILDAAIAHRRLGAIAFSGLWIDVGTPERLSAARSLPPRV